MRILVLGLVWAATLAAGIYVGRTTADDAGAATAAGARAGADAGANEGIGTRATPPPAAHLRGAPDARTPAARSTASDEASAAGVVDPSTLPPFSLEGVETAEQANAVLMRYAAAYLAQGKEGHLALLKLLDEEVVDNEDLERLFGSDEESARFLYPWLRFLVQREAQVVDLTETVFETLAERPEALGELDGDTLEVFTMGIALVLPGVVDEPRMDVFRGHLRTILARVPEADDGGLQNQMRRLQRLAVVWAPRLTGDQALARLRDGAVRGAEAAALLGRVPPDQLAGLDLGAILAPMVRRGDFETLNRLSTLPLSGRDIVALDDALLEGAQAGTVHDWWVGRYLKATKRATWPAAQGLVERGLALGGSAAASFALGLRHLKPMPDASYLRWVVENHSYPTGIADRLRDLYGLR